MTNISQYFGHEPSLHGKVYPTADLQRILALPTKGKIDRDLCASVSKYLGSNGEQILYPHQLEILEHLSQHRGCFGEIPMGEGKTLVLFLAPRVVQARKPIVMIPAGDAKKTERDFSALERIWGPNPTPVEIVHYELLSRKKELLQELAPDFLGLDECHMLRNGASGRTRRFWRFAKENYERCKFLAMSGTITSRSILDFHHLLLLALGPELCPLPVSRSEAAMWARALDVKTDVPARPGALELFLGEGEEPTIDNIRAAVKRRRVSTPGVVHLETSRCAASLKLSTIELAEPPEVQEPLKALVKKRVAPDGTDECTPADVFRHTRTLTLGFAYRWREAGPPEWMKARRAFKATVRSFLEIPNPDYDTEEDVVRAWLAGSVTLKTFDRWFDICDSFRPVSYAYWYSDETLRKIPRLVDEYTIVWVAHRAVGQKLQELYRWPYYRNKGLTRDGAYIEDHPPGQPAVASIKANHFGKNLQHRFYKNLILTLPEKGEVCDQLLGRTHRLGQAADAVHAVFNVRHQQATMRQLLEDAKYQHNIESPKKLITADWL